MDRKHRTILAVSAYLLFAAACTYAMGQQWFSDNVIFFFVIPIFFAAYTASRNTYAIMLLFLLGCGIYLRVVLEGGLWDSVLIVLGPTAVTMVLSELLHLLGVEVRIARMERDRLATAIDQAGEAIMITDADGDIVFVNPAFEKVTGFTREEALGKNPSILKSGTHSDAFYENMWRTLCEGKVWKGALTNKRKDGGLYEEDSTISPVRDEDGVIRHFVAIKRDRSHELQLEKQARHAQKMRALGTLAGGVAHDFNNILSLVLGHCELAQRCVEPGHEIMLHLRQIDRSATRATSLIRQLLAFSRSDEDQPRALNLTPLVKETLVLLRATIEASIAIETLLEARNDTVLADPTQVNQVLMNLVTNAYQAITGRGRITVRLHEVSLGDDFVPTVGEVPEGPCVCLSVSDTGPGIPEETISQVFEPFYTTKDVGKGTGLGLATVHGIMTRCGGCILIESTVGEGTCVRVFWPRYEAPLSEEA